MAETPNGKDVIYIDIDDEITGIIEKVRDAKQHIVALVLPKRSTVMQSIVNMKLLKRAASEDKKNIVLITGEEGLLPLAGNVGIYIAKSLQSKPEIPDAPPKPATKADEIDEAINMEEAPETDVPLDKTRPIGELAGAGEIEPDDADMPIELDNSDGQPLDNSKADGKKHSKIKDKKPGKDKKLKVPNFNKFRNWVLLGGTGLVVFIVLLIFCLKVLPKAKVTINTNSQNVNVSLLTTLNTSANSVNSGTEVAPAIVAQVQKTYTGQTATTGKQNNGQTASGSVTMTAQECNTIANAADVPAGTGISANNITFLTQQDTSFTIKNIKNGCINFVATSPTPVTAQSAGSNGNIGPSSFNVAGRPDITASSGNPMTGGTDNIVQIVAQADINDAQSQINPDTNSLKSQLESNLQNQGLYPVPSTFTASTPTTTDSASVGAVANNVTVTENITYTMFGAKRSDLQQIIASSVDGQINITSQKILNYGLDNANISLQSQTSGTAVINMQVSALVGSSLSPSTIRKQVAGEKSGEAVSAIENYPGVKSVSVHLSPFWVSSIPKDTKKITIVIVNPGQ